MISFSYTVKSVLGGYLRIMAGGRPRKTGSTEKRSYKNDVKRQFEAQKFLLIGKWKVRFQRMFKDVSSQSSLVTSFSYTVKPVLGGHLRRMAGGGGPT